MAARPSGLPFGRIFGGLGVLAGVANGVMSLSRMGGEDQAASHNLAYLTGYFFGSAVISGLIGLVFGVALGYFVRSVGHQKPAPGEHDGMRSG